MTASVTFAAVRPIRRLAAEIQVAECGSKALARSADDGYSNDTAPRHRRRAAKFELLCRIMMSFFVI
jgi:hypothetical protein